MQPPHANSVLLSPFPRGWSGKAGNPFPLAAFMRIVKGDLPNRYADAITELRRLDKTANKSRYNAIKQALPAVSISTLCEAGKTSAHTYGAHTGVIAIDIDAADNPSVTPSEWAPLRDELARLFSPFCYMAALSAGGRGLFMLLAISAADGAQHRAIFATLQRLFADRYGVTVDKSCNNPNRLRVLSYDHGAYINDSPAEAYALPTPSSADEEPPAFVTSKTAAPPRRRPGDGHRDHRDHAGDDYAHAAITVLIAKGGYFANYADWLAAAGALQTVTDGAALFRAVSRNNPDYRDGDEAKYYTAKLTRYTPGTLVYLCRQAGVTDAEVESELQRRKWMQRPAPSPRQSAPSAPRTAATTTAAPPQSPSRRRENDGSAPTLAPSESLHARHGDHDDHATTTAAPPAPPPIRLHADEWAMRLAAADPYMYDVIYNAPALVPF